MPSRSAIAAYWDAAAPSFDEPADHGLRDPSVRSAWAAALRSWLPDRSADVADLGCGTGSLSLLAAHLGHRVIGIDLSAAMIEHARRKAGNRFVVGDAAAVPLRPGCADVILARHVLWTLPDPAATLRRWVTLCRPGGRLVLIEGRWDTGGYVAGSTDLPWTGGVTARTLAVTLRPLVMTLQIQPLTDPVLWGRPITDERYAIICTASRA